MRTLTCSCVLVLSSAILAAQPPAALTVPAGELVEGVACLSDPTQTYTLYLPSAYSSNRTWPALFVFDPRGRSVQAAERFRAAAERWGWLILSSNDTRSDGPWEPNLKAIQAMWPEVHERFAVNPDRIYAAGMSGGGNVAFVLGKTANLAGVIASGTRLVPEQLDGTRFAVFAAAGDRDFNYQEMRRVDEYAAGLGNPHRFESFEGLHEWLPSELASQAVAWMEIEAMKADPPTRDEKVIRERFRQDLESARALESAGDLLAAERRYRMIARTYAEIHDTSPAVEAADRLSGSRDFKRALKDERRWLGWESSMRQRFAQAYAWLQQGDLSPTPAEFKIAIGLSSISKHASTAGIEGLTAQRLLSTLYAETSYYIGPPLLQAGRWREAAAVLTVATEVADGWWPATTSWYNLACAHARSGNRRDALDALERAVQDGFGNLDHLQSDPDLASLHDDERFQSIVESLGSGTGEPGVDSTTPSSESTAH